MSGLATMSASDCAATTMPPADDTDEPGTAPMSCAVLIASTPPAPARLRLHATDTAAGLGKKGSAPMSDASTAAAPKYVCAARGDRAVN